MTNAAAEKVAARASMSVVQSLASVELSEQLDSGELLGAVVDRVIDRYCLVDDVVDRIASDFDYDTLADHVSDNIDTWSIQETVTKNITDDIDRDEIVEGVIEKISEQFAKQLKLALVSSNGNH